MGIILEKSKLVFDELIGQNSFDEIFKNSIRDYYTYGFKSYDQFTKGSQIVKERWKVFSRVLGAKWYFEKRKNGRNQITLKTEAAGIDNPVDDLYFLHNLSKIGDYLNYILDLDENSIVRGGLKQLPVDVEELETVEGKDGAQSLLEADEIQYAIISNWKLVLDNEIERPEKPFPIRINRQMNIWSSRTRYMPASYRDKYANLSNRTEYLYELGILGDLRDNPKKRNLWLRSQWEKYDSSFKKYFASTKSGNHYWYKSPLTMKFLCEQTSLEEKMSSEDISQQLRAMCDFFSQYYPLGELGTVLSERLGGRVETYDSDSIRFKHNYLQKSLYDYNLIDILIAIENNYFCLIEYSHGVNLKTQIEIGIPLEIRISVTNGREYVMYYDVSKKRIRALRLEFIDKISVFSHVDSIESIQYLVKKEGKKIQREEIKRSPVPIDDNIAHNVAIAYKMLPFIWGTEVSECYVTDDWKERLVNISFQIKYDSEQERYIGSRIIKEGRVTKSDRIITIFPTKEIRSWVRSFYKRLDISAEEDIGSFDVAADVNAVWNVYYGKKALLGDGVPEYKKNEDTAYTEYNCIVKGNLVSELKGHGALFNELFSRYSGVLANTVLECSSPTVNEALDIILTRNIKDAFSYYTDEEIQKVKNELKTVIYESELLSDSGMSRFVIETKNYLYDFLPLTKLELRWLKTVLNDPLSRIFLSEEQIELISEALNIAPYDIIPLAMDAINYFDRYNLEERIIDGKKKITQQGRHSKREISFIRTINQAVKNEEKLKVVFSNWKGEKRVVSCAPVWLEYSRRDDIFRLWYIDNKLNAIRKINVSRILNVSIITGGKYNKSAERAKMRELLDNTMKSIKVEFYQGEKNLPDRLLTEFSLWKKKCIFNIKKQKYTMTLHYSSLDEKEILIRLLGYGPYIRIVADEDNYVLAELKERIVLQRDLIQEREFGLDREKDGVEERF